MTAQRKFDPDIAALFIENYREALRASQSLATSVRRTAGLFPLDGHALDALDDDAREKLDAFRVRFSGLQDLLSNKLFRGILLLEEEAPQSMLDILNAMEKRGVIKSFDDWKSARDLRNAFMHEYPDHLDICAAALPERMPLPGSSSRCWHGFADELLIMSAWIPMISPECRNEA